MRLQITIYRKENESPLNQLKLNKLIKLAMQSINEKDEFGFEDCIEEINKSEKETLK